jgi:hypothetical protein
MSIHRIAVVVTLLVSCAATASAQAVKLEFHDGKVNLTTQNAPLRTILTEWGRLGGTQMVNLEKITGAPLTLQLTNVTETQALDAILRGNAGYLVGLRAAGSPTQSAFDKILLVPTAGTSAVTSRPGATPPPFTPPAAVQPPQPDPDDNPVGDVPPDDDRRAPPGSRQPPADQPQPQPAGPANPFGVQPGSSRPGVISPVPQQPPQRPRSQPDNEP